MESLHVVEQATNDVSAPEPRLEPPWPQLPPAAVEERRERGANHLEARRVHGLLRLATLEGQEDDGRLAFAVVRGRVEELAHAERRADEGQVGVDHEQRRVPGEVPRRVELLEKLEAEFATEIRMPTEGRWRLHAEMREYMLEMLETNVPGGGCAAAEKFLQRRVELYKLGPLPHDQPHRHQLAIDRVVDDAAHEPQRLREVAGVSGNQDEP